MSINQVNHTQSRFHSIHINDLLNERVSNYLQQSIPEDFGSGHSKFFQLDPDINFIDTHYKPSRDFKIFSRQQEQPARVIVTLALQGNSVYKQHHGEDILFNQGHSTITSFTASQGERLYQADEVVKQLRIAISKEGIQRYFGDKYDSLFFSENKVKTLSQRPISAESLQAIQLLNQCKVHNDCSKMFVQVQALTILMSELSFLFDEETQPLGYTKKDKSLVVEAREILLNEYKNPPTVTELANRVGTNQFRLKQLFHFYFDSTPYNMLLQIRMETAYKLLETGNFHVNTVADQVGYAHPNNFSVAFKKFFSISPKQIRKLNIRGFK